MTDPTQNSNKSEISDANNTSYKNSDVIGPKIYWAGEWMYEDRKALIMTGVIFGLLFLNIFMISLVIGNQKLLTEQADPNTKESIREIKLLDKEDELRMQLIAQYANNSYKDVRNVVSNANAKDNRTSSRRNYQQTEDNWQETERQIEERLLAEDRQLQDQIRANRELYEDGLRVGGENYDNTNTQTPPDRQNTNKPTNTNVEQGDTKTEGRVTVSFSLGNPIRNASSLHVPAYRCESGGRVVVNITVNRNGNVTSAEVDKSLSSSDYCMTTAATESAYASRFNVNQAAPAKQNGTITYIFIPQ